MEALIEILRQRNNEDKSYIQTFRYEYEDDSETVATALTGLNACDGLKDVDGEPADRIVWECNCLQKKCGACAMVINGIPKLACDARISSEKKPIRLEPLKKFPIIADLMVDRSILFKNLSDIKLWFDGEAKTHDATFNMAYEASRCLQCACCVEVCPNFMPGRNFYGMATAVPMARLLSKLPDEQKKEASKLYSKHIFEGCGKSLSCRNICPAKIDIDDMLVKSNAIAVWKKYINK